MQQALINLRAKKIEISDEELEGCLIAILLHDIGHGPFSHTLEFNLLKDVKHERISLIFFERLNMVFHGQLSLALSIFSGTYERGFFHQLVSSQLDIDRLDYLKRDSFFTGVSEGSIGSERIINMLNVVDDQIVVEEKGIYSIEHFLSARRLMYWQVYLHKTSVAAEEMMIQITKRAKKLTKQGMYLGATPALQHFLEKEITIQDFEEDDEILELFSLLDDSDIWGSMKFWRESDDLVLSKLSKDLLRRKIFKIHLDNEKLGKEKRDSITNDLSEKLGLKKDELEYLTAKGSITNSAYIQSDQKIKILNKKGALIDIDKAADLPNIKAMSKIVTKHYFCWAQV